MYFRQLLNDESACASYLFGCKTHSKFAVVDPHIDLVDDGREGRANLCERDVLRHHLLLYMYILYSIARRLSNGR